MNQNKAKIFLINILLMIFGAIIVYLSVYFGLKNYFRIIYIVPTGAVLLSFGIFLIMLSLFLFFYNEYWNIVKEIIFQRILLNHKIIWISIVFFFGILFFSAFISIEIYNIVRTIPVLPMQFFEILNFYGEPWIEIYSIILRYSVGLWITVIIWYYIIKKILKKEIAKNFITNQNNIKEVNDDIKKNEIIQNKSKIEINHIIAERDSKSYNSLSSRIKKIIWNKYAIVFILAFLLRLIIYFNTYPGYDTGFYLFLVKDVVQNNNFNIFFGNKLSFSQQNLALTAFPTCIPLIGLSYLTGGDALLAATIYIPILSVIVIFLCYKIVEKAINSKTIAFLTEFFLSFSVIQLTLISGLYKQLTTIFITLLVIYILFFSKRSSLSKFIISFFGIGFLILIDIFYFLTIGVFFLIITNYLLIKKSINWKFLKNSRHLLALKIIFIASLILISGSITYLYFQNAIPLIDLTIFYGFLFKLINPPMTSLWSMIYNNLILFIPFLFTFIFAIYGFLNDYRYTRFNNKNFQLFLQISFLTLIIFTFSEIFNLSFFYLADRFLIFFEYVVIVYASIGIVEVYKLIKSNYSKIGFFQKSKRFFIGIFLFCIILSSILSIPYYRFGKLAQPEKEGIIWLLYNGNTEKLTNNLRNDVIVVSNHHLEYWIQYLIHYNAINTQMYWKIGNILRNVPVDRLVASANETIYFLVSKIREPSGETWNDVDVINYILEINNTLNKNYYLIYNNSIIYIYEIMI